MSLPTQNSEYGTKEYWESRYSEADDSETFDWFKDYESIKGEIKHLLPSKTSSIINLGCGNSLFAPQLQKEGWTNITNVDYSDACIFKMKRIYPDMQWIVCDVFKMDKLFSEGMFDSAIDKGTLDAFLTKKHDPWDPEPEILEEIRSYIIQVAKVLRSGGAWFLLF